MAGDKKPKMDTGKAKEARDVELRMGKSGPLSCAHNDLLMVTLEISLVVRFNEHTQTIEVQGLKANMEITGVTNSWTTLTDGLVATLATRISTLRKYEMPTDRIWRALTAAAEANKFDPVKAWLRSLPPWDGEDRVPAALAALKVKHSDLDEAYLRTWFCGMAGRAFKPGTKFDGVLIIVGREGGGKSTFFASLVPYAEWFTDSMSVKQLENPKEAGMCGAGCLIVELAELSGMKMAEAEALKSAVTRTSDKFRFPWGRVFKDVPRHWVLGGTTNSEEYLRDTGGNRRFWGIETTSHTTDRIDIPWVIENRDQLWAQALHRVTTLGAEALVLPDALVLEQQERAASAVVTTAWDDQAAEWLNFLDTVGCKDGSGTVGHDAWISNVKLLEFLKIERGQGFPDNEFYKVKTALSRAGFKPKRPRGVSREAEAHTGSDRPRILVRGDLEKARLLDVSMLKDVAGLKIGQDGKIRATDAHGMRFLGVD